MLSNPMYTGVIESTSGTCNDPVLSYYEKNLLTKEPHKYRAGKRRLRSAPAVVLGFFACARMVHPYVRSITG